MARVCCRGRDRELEQRTKLEDEDGTDLRGERRMGDFGEKLEDLVFLEREVFFGEGVGFEGEARENLCFRCVCTA
ncbi:hypothetical protein SLA2020_334250 [Shorea laevis]